MKLVKQPTNSNLCGQSCVATILGISLDEAIKLVGTKGKTDTKDLCRAIWQGSKHLIFSSWKAIRNKGGLWDNLPYALLIVRVRKGKQSHWMVYDKGKYYDPAAGVFRKPPKWQLAAGAKPTSYILLQPCDPRCNSPS